MAYYDHKHINFKKSYECEGYDFRDNNNCTVLAMVNMFNLTYQRAYDIMASLGRVRGKGFGFHWMINGLVNSTYKRHEIFNSVEISHAEVDWKWNTLTKFLLDHPTGNYFVFTKCHVLVVRDGVLIDNRFSPKRRVQLAYEVKFK